MTLVLPPELWQLILHYIGATRHQYATVCSEWGRAGGLIDQSVISLDEEDYVGNKRYSLKEKLASFTHLKSYGGTLHYGAGLEKLKGRGKQLTELRLYGRCLESEMEIISNLTTLKALHIYLYPISQWNPITNLSNLTKLTLCTATDSELCLGNSFPHLHTLLLREAYIRDESLAQLSALHTLSLKDSPNITAASLRSLTRLRHLTLKGDQLHATIAGHVLERLTNLQSLSLKVKHAHAAPIQISHLANLSTLRLGDNLDYSMTSLRHFTALRQVEIREYLNPRHTNVQFTDSLRYLSNVTDLRLFGRKPVGVPTLKLVAQLLQLTTLHIYVEELWPGIFTALSALTELHLSSYEDIKGSHLQGLSASVRRLELLYTHRPKDVNDILTTITTEPITSLQRLRLYTENYKASETNVAWQSLSSLKLLHTIHCTSLDAAVISEVLPHIKTIIWY